MVGRVALAEQEEDCPVDELLCVSRMETLRAEIRGIKQTVKVVGATITIIVSIVAVLSRWL